MTTYFNGRPTKRALDTGDSAAISGIFLASSFSCSQAESTPAPAPVTQTVRWRLITRAIITMLAAWAIWRLAFDVGEV